MAQKLCDYSMEMVDDSEVRMVHIGEQDDDGYFAEAVEFEIDINGMGARITIPVDNEEDRISLMRGLVRLHKSLASCKGKQEINEDDDDDDEEVEGGGDDN